MSETKLLRCPFCGGEFKIIPLDDGFNIHLEDGYEENPWSGIQYGISHESGENQDCPIATHDGELLGVYGYDTKEEAINALNTRKPMQNIVERLEEELKLSDKDKRRCVADKNFLQFDEIKGYANGIYNAIEIVKEEGGINGGNL